MLPNSIPYSELESDVMAMLLSFGALFLDKPFDQARDAAQQEEEEGRADSIWKKLRLQECKKSFTNSTKMDFMRLLNELE